MIDTNTYYIAYYLEKVQVFAISLKNILHQVEKEVRVDTNLKIVIPKKYYNFLNIFSQKNLDLFLLY